MSIYYDENQATAVENVTSIAKGERTGFMENFNAAYNAFTRSETFASERNNYAEEYGNIVEILNKTGHADFVSPYDNMLTFSGEGEEQVVGYKQVAKIPNRQELEVDFWNKISELQTTDENLKSLLVEAGLDTPDNMKATIASKAHSAWEEFEKINERASGEWYSFGGKTGGFVGMAGGAFTDPIMLGGVAASFGYSIPTGIGAAALRVAYMEAIIGGVTETLIQLKAQPYRKELGFEDAGLETGLKNIAMVTGASAVLSPLLLGVFKSFGKSIEVGQKYLAKVPTEDLQKIKQELNNVNSKYKDDALDNYKFPEKDIPNNTPAARTEHNERLNTAVKQFQDGEPVDLPPIRNKIIYHGTDKYFKEFDLNKTADQSIWFTDDINAIKAGKVGASGKGNIIERIIDENKIKLATAEQADKYVDQQLIAMGYDGVKFSKAEGFDDNSYRIFNTEKLDKTGSVQSKSGFNKNETNLAEDIEGVKDFDVPTEAAYRNQASVSEGEMSDAGTSAAIRVEAEAGAAAKTVPIDNPLAKTQDLVSKSQETDAALSSTVLATAQSKPPLIRGLANKSVGDFNSIGIRLYQKSNNYKEIYKTLSKKIDSVKNELQPIATKYNGDLKARVKDEAKIKEKLAIKEQLTPQNIPDWLGARISVDTITEAKLLLSELNKIYKLIEIDDFLDDVARTQRKNPTEYRRIHTQALTKDGFSFELQISLKELDPKIDRSHAAYKKITYQRDSMSMDEWNKTLKEQAKAEADMKKTYFKIKDKEFSRLNPTNEVDAPIVVGQRLDDATGEIVPLYKTRREMYEEDAKSQTMFERLKDCV
jgi:hypothetical protein